MQINRVFALLPIVGILGRLMDLAIWALRGGCRIVDSDGTLLGLLGDAEGACTGEAARVLVMVGAEDRAVPVPQHYSQLPALTGARSVTGRCSPGPSRHSSSTARSATSPSP